MADLNGEIWQQLDLRVDANNITIVAQDCHLGRRHFTLVNLFFPMLQCTLAPVDDENYKLVRYVDHSPRGVGCR